MYVVFFHAFLFNPCLACSLAAGNGVPVPYGNVVLDAVVLDGLGNACRVGVFDIVGYSPSLLVLSCLAQFVRKNYSDKISAHRNGWNVDMPPANTSKVTGIYEYAKMFDNPEIYTVGDNVNDLLMIKEFCGYAVSNAVPSVKEAAKHQCTRVADMIDELLKGE